MADGRALARLVPQRLRQREVVEMRRLPSVFSYGCDRHAVSRGHAFWMSVCSGAGSASLMYLLDPERGRRRRRMLCDIGLARMRRGVRGTAALSRAAAAAVYATGHRLFHLVPREPDVGDDETLRQRVESQLFRHRHVPKGELNITVEHGTIILRGELSSVAEITALDERVRHIPGVRGVQNLLHPHGTPAPNKERSLLAAHTN
jgi:BON domain